MNKWQPIKLGTVMRAVAFRGWDLRKGLHHLVLTTPAGRTYELQLRPPSIRGTTSAGWWNNDKD